MELPTLSRSTEKEAGITVSLYDGGELVDTKTTKYGGSAGVILICC